MKKVCLILMISLFSIGMVQAQDTSTPDTSSTCNPAELNWCFAGQPWGDGRCDDPDPNVTTYNYQQGFYQAAAFCGIIDSAPSATFFDEDGALSFSCTVRQSDDDKIDVTANWSRRVKNQSRVVFRFDVEVVGVNIVNGISPTVGSFDTSTSATRSYVFEDLPVELKSNAVAYIIDGFDNPITDRFTCTVRN